MRKLFTLLLSLAALTASAQSHVLWYDHPATDWHQALPIGNGHIGGMVYGGTATETIALNDDTFWSGSPNDNNSPEALAYLPEVRRLIFEGHEERAADLINKHFIRQSWGQKFLDAGELRLDFGHTEANYRRELRLGDGLTTVAYTSGGVDYRRTAFASLTDGVLVVRIEASRKHALGFTLTHHSRYATASIANRKTATLSTVMHGTSHEGVEGKLVDEVRIHVQTDGKADAQNGKITVANARTATIYICSATNYKRYDDISANPERLNTATMRAATGLGYKKLLARHQARYRELYGRMTLCLPRDGHSSLPTDRRLEQFADGKDWDFVSLMMQYGRYLLISSSMPGTQPANLQGLWNNKQNAPWDSKYTININTEMNYWPAEVCNLPETAEPLFSMLDDLSHTGATTARTLYGCDGWTAHHNTDLWRIAGPVDGATWGQFPNGGAWLATHLWQHYLYTGDKDFLNSHYDVIAGTARFYLDYLQRHPRYGWLVAVPSVSPEHGPNGKKTPVTAGCTMDNQIVFDALTNTLAAARTLGRDSALQVRLADAISQLPPMQIGRYGQLQEWLWDGDREKDEHRHISQLYGLYPSNQISPFTQRGLFEAAATTLQSRGDMATGWSLGWKTNFWARMLDGNHALHIITNMLHLLPIDSLASRYPDGRTYPNLFDAHPPFQIDGNFGVAAGIAEMLCQSHDGAVHILPALPEAWDEGSVHGIRARGGYTLDIEWRGGQLTHLHVKAGPAGTLRLRSYTPLSGLDKAEGPCPNPLFVPADIKTPTRTAEQGAKPSVKADWLRPVYEYDVKLAKGGEIDIRTE